MMRFDGNDINRVLNTRGKKRLAVFAITSLVTLTLLAAGLWNADAPLRRPAQATLFFAARHAPRSLVPRMTRWALQAHVAGTTYSEIAEAASLLERAGEGNAASTLLLGLVRQDVASQNWERAIYHATLSNNAATGKNPDALASLVILNVEAPEFRDHWLAQLQESYPDSEIAQVFKYLGQVASFHNALPASSESVDWVHQKALAGQSEYRKITQQIADLPKESARNIKQYENSIAEISKEQAAYKNRYDALTAEIYRLEKEGLGNAVGEWLWNSFPLPKKGDTFGSYIAREGLCALPLIKVICRLLDLEPFYELRKKQQELADSRSRVVELLDLNNSLITDYRSDIKYWQSSEPLNKLIKARQDLVPAFRRDVEQEIASRREQIGMPVSDAITIIAAR